MPAIARAVCTIALGFILSVTTAFAQAVQAAGKNVQGMARGKVAPLELKKPASSHPWQRYKVDSQGSSWPQTDWSAYNTLAAPALPTEDGSLQFLTPIEGDPAKGRQLAFDRARGGSCVSCHVLGKDTPPQPGNIGPDLSTVGATRTDDWLFNYVYDPRKYNKTTIMPPWGAHKIMSIPEIKDVVAFLKTLREPYVFKDPQDNPATRTPPRETRDNLDQTDNPAFFALDRGKTAFKRIGPDGKSCASCHTAPEEAFKTWAGRMPKYETRLNKVIGVEEFITRHARATTGDDILMQSDDNIGLSIFLHNIANGAPINPDLSNAGAKLAVKRGQELMQRKLGQLNMACIDCHTRERHANKWARGQYLVEFKGTIAHFPTWRTSRGDIWDIRKRFQWCNVSVRANELPPDASQYGEIEMALAAFNKGQKVSSPGIRH